MATSMTKAQLVSTLADATGGDKKAASAMLDALTSIITRTVSEGGSVTLPGVGKILCRERPERMARNPATGEQIRKDADRAVKIIVAKALKTASTGKGARDLVGAGPPAGSMQAWIHARMMSCKHMAMLSLTNPRLSSPPLPPA